MQYNSNKYYFYNTMQPLNYDNNETVTDSEFVLMSLADDMAQAATVFQGHGYETFIKAREAFKASLHEIITSLSK